MKVTVTRIFTFDSKQVQEFMEEFAGYEKGEYSEEDILDELDSAEASDLELYGDCDFMTGHDIDIKEK